MSIKRALPTVVFGVSIALALFCASIFLIRSYALYGRVIDDHAVDVVAALETELAQGDAAQLGLLVNNLAPNRLVIELNDGTVISTGETADVRQAGRVYPLKLNDIDVGTVTLVPRWPFWQHLSWVSVIGALLFCATFVSFVTWLLATQLANYMREMSNLVSSVSLKTMGDLPRPQVRFLEFRKLSVVAQRTIRRLGQEVELLRRRAEIDDRTGLYNQYYLKTRLEACVEAVRFDEPAAMLLIHVDGLSELSVQLGTSRYMDCLSLIGSELEACTREHELKSGMPVDSWTLACLPSDQFGLLATGLSSRDDIAPLVRKIHARLRDISGGEDIPTQLNASGAIVMIPEDGDNHGIVLQRAETTLQSVRSDETRGFRFYSPKLDRQNESRRRLEAELRKAVADKRFVPLFQPKIDMKTGKVCGVEALARWQLESGRLASPAVFIGLAEEIGLIADIGEQIMHRSCRAMAQLAREGHKLSLAVNVSPRQFETGDLASMILDALTQSGLSPRQLELEITESLAIEQPERVRAVLTPLRKMGIRLAVDDFGTGHSNLAVLTQFEFDVFKIDRQFVSGLPTDSQSIAIIDLMFGMAKSLNMQIVGEGIETQAQARYMASHGCHIAQGYLYSPPISEAALRKMLQEEAARAARKIA